MVKILFLPSQELIFLPISGTTTSVENVSYRVTCWAQYELIGGTSNLDSTVMRTFLKEMMFNLNI